MPAGHIAFGQQPLLGNFVTDDAANDSTTNRSGSTTAGQHGTADSAGTGTDGGALPLRRHTGTGAQTEQGGHDNSAT